MGKALKRTERDKAHRLLLNFFNGTSSVDIVACCDEYGKCIFYDVPYEVCYEQRFNETIVIIKFDWEKSGKREIVSGTDFIDELPKTPFTTIYNSFIKTGKSNQDPISFNTSKGYRHLIYFFMYAHSNKEEQLSFIKKILNECQ